MFKDAKIGDTLYIYDRVAITLNTEKIVNVTAPHIDKTNMSNGMIVDIAVSNNTYSFKDATEIGYTANLIISADKAAVLREVESQKASNETQIARVDQLKAELPKLDAVIDALNPERKERKLNEERMAKIEEKLGALTEMFELALKEKRNGSK